MLLGNLLERISEAGDIPFDAPAVPAKALPFPSPTIEEIRNLILKASNNTPSLDEVPTKILQIAWILIESSVVSLFYSYLQAGHHPQCFYEAIVAIIVKLNKADKTSPRSYRPIALLSVLRKGLERLLAKRMSWIAVKFKVLSNQ